MSIKITRANTLYGFPNPQLSAFPDPIVAPRAPTVTDRAIPGQIWIDQNAQLSYIFITTTGGNSIWVVQSNNGGAAVLTSLIVNGPSIFAGNITQTAGTTTLLATTTAGLTNNGDFINNTGRVQINPSATPVQASLTVIGQNTATQPTSAFTAAVAGKHEAVQFVNQNAASTGTCEISVITTNQDAGAGRIGDAQIRLTDTVFGGFTLGKDASAGDFVISQGGALGTNNRLTINGTTGAVNLPVQPCFSYFLNANTGGVTGGGGQPVIGFNTASLGSPYFAAGRFTAPVTGNYLLGTSVSVGAVDVAMTEGVLFINIYNAAGTPTQIYEFNRCNPGAIKSATNVVGFQGQIIAPMNATDYVEITCQLSNGANNAIYEGQPQRKTNFYGQLIS